MNLIIKIMALIKNYIKGWKAKLLLMIIKLNKIQICKLLIDKKKVMNKFLPKVWNLIVIIMIKI
jgi:hypothetical protein